MIDETGYFYSIERMAEFLAQAEVEAEFRAQIETVLAAQIKPTHLDWHCLHSGGRWDIFEMTMGLAKEYGLALRVYEQPLVENVQSQGLPTGDHNLLDSFRLDPATKAARYAQLLRELPVGLSEWAVHPGLDNNELRALEPNGKRVRQTDFDFVMSQEAQDIVEAEGIILLDYRPLQAAWRGA